ncbi:MAG: 50S ribosomal protein L11 methyltransferase [Sphingomonadaceae bacterium]|nr:50S ribosomal protein L11 methyltransferase [Sphingomonadaceae bacterium]
MSASWKVGLPCTRAEAEAIAADIAPLGELDPPPVLATSEADPATPDQWRLDAYFERRPGKAAISMLRALAPSASAAEPVVERVAEQDWVRLSQQAIRPIEAGRFFVHTASFAGGIPRYRIAFRIEASRAFGTGAHETTRGCLIMLDTLKARRARFANICDIGTGTGLLAFAALALWPRARAIASDIDPVAIEIARENMAINAIAEGRGSGALELVVAQGLAHCRLRRRAPYDLVIANILADPLITLAPAVARALAPGGTLILAGLLGAQAAQVIAAYRRRGLRLAGRSDEDDWAILRLVKRPG